MDKITPSNYHKFLTNFTKMELSKIAALNAKLERTIDEDVCDYCKHHIFDGNVNTNQYNMCEGLQCDAATDGFLSHLKDIADEDVENIEFK